MKGKAFRSIWGALAGSAVLAPVAALAQGGQPAPGQIGFQPAVTPIMDSIHAFHDGLLMWIITGITLFVLALLVWVIVRYNQKANPVPGTVTHNTLVEIVWTVVPILILIVIAIPSFGVLADQQTIPDGERLYLADDIFSGGSTQVPAPELTIKVTGFQWYWGYDYVDSDVSITSILLNEEQRAEQKPDQPRLLAVDNELIVPVDTTVRVQVTGGDVIHSFAMPSFGIKVDAVPGRLNESWFYARETGIFYGQCSELCGKDHAFMPIAVRVVSKDEFANWLETAQSENLDAAYTQLAEAQSAPAQ